MNALPPERAWRVAALWSAFARKLSLKRADRVLHRQTGRPLVGVGDRNEPANRVGARLDVELHIAAGPEQPPLRRWPAMPTPFESDRVGSVIDAILGAHSAKPDIFAELIEAWCPPELARIELFRRGPARPDRAAWCNEAKAA